jgi:hypothetical protein
MPQEESMLAIKIFMAAGIGLMGCIWLLTGCAEVVVPGAMAGGGAGKAFTGLRASVSVFLKRTSPSLSVAIDARWQP